AGPSPGPVRGREYEGSPARCQTPPHGATPIFAGSSSRCVANGRVFASHRAKTAPRQGSERLAAPGRRSTRPVVTTLRAGLASEAEDSWSERGPAAVFGNHARPIGVASAGARRRGIPDAHPREGPGRRATTKQRSRREEALDRAQSDG